MVFAHVLLKLRINRLNLSPNGRDHFFNAGSNQLAGHLQALAFGELQSQQLPPSDYKCAQRGSPRVQRWKNEVCKVGATKQCAPKLRQHLRVNPIRLRQAPHCLCEVSSLLGVYYGHSQPSLLKRARQGCFVSSSCLHDHQVNLDMPQRTDERVVSWRIVVELLGVPNRAQHRDVYVRLGHVNAYHHRGHRHDLQIPCL